MKIFASCYICDALKSVSGAELLPLAPYDKLDAPVNTHADMLVFLLGRKIFCYSDYYIKNKKIFDIASSDGYEIVKISKECAKKYPDDISLNVLKMGNVLYSSIRHTAPEILDYANELGYEIVDVKQGYSACSTLVLDENNAITADKSIFKALLSSGKSVTLISEGHIALEGYDYGFIGGASCVIGDKIYFFGDITRHPDYEKIHQKIISTSKIEIAISRGEVFDFGGARPLL